MTPRQADRYRVALHEAAHAVAAADLGLHCEFVTLVPKKGALAFMRHTALTTRALNVARGGDNAFAHVARADAIADFAGPAVELLVFGASKFARADVASATRSARVSGIPLLELQLEAERLARKRLQAINLVARKLEQHRTLSGAAVALLARQR